MSGSELLKSRDSEAWQTRRDPVKDESSGNTPESCLDAEIWENTSQEAPSRNLKITDECTENKAVAPLLSHTKGYI